MTAPAISIDMRNGLLALGQKNGAIEILEAKAGATTNTVMLKHSEGEVWGLPTV
jgi:hypothetical protein